MQPWVPPLGEVRKATIIRARTFSHGKMPSNIVTRTYFIGSLGSEIKSAFKPISVISLVSDEKHLFSDSAGIYVPGISYTGKQGEGNYMKKWNRPAQIQFFNESGDYIMGDYALQSFTNFTAMAFVNIAGDGYGDGYNGIFNVKRGNPDGFRFAIDPYNGVWMDIGSNGGGTDELNTSADVITRGVWHHIAVIGVSEQYMRIYVDGNDVGSNTTTKAIGTPGQGPYMGTYDTSSNGNMNGTIDELMVFNRSLSKTEIDTIITYFS